MGEFEYEYEHEYEYELMSGYAKISSVSTILNFISRSLSGSKELQPLRFTGFKASQQKDRTMDQIVQALEDFLNQRNSVKRGDKMQYTRMGKRDDLEDFFLFSVYTTICTRNEIVRILNVRDECNT